MKKFICTSVGAVGSVIVSLLGGWDSLLVTLLIFMIIDYISGLVVAGVFHTSKKSSSGALESRAGFKGLVKKCIILLFVIVANRLDIVLDANYFRNCVCIAYITNELISIVENAGLMGIPIPQKITKAIGILTEKGDSENGKI